MKVRSVGIRSQSIFWWIVVGCWWLLKVVDDWGGCFDGCWFSWLNNPVEGFFDEFFRWLKSTLDAGKGVARRVDLSTLWFPSPTVFPIGNTSTNWWDFLKPKLHARFLRDIPQNYHRFASSLLPPCRGFGFSPRKSHFQTHSDRSHLVVGLLALNVSTPAEGPIFGGDFSRRKPEIDTLMGKPTKLWELREDVCWKTPCIFWCN